MQAWREKSETLSIFGGKKPNQPRVLCPAKLTFKSVREIKTLIDK